MNRAILLGPVPQPPAECLDVLLLRRRSVRSFEPIPIGKAQLSSMVWAALGRRDDTHRVVPSAHALYPLMLTVIVGQVDDLSPGVYRYDPHAHALLPVAGGDHRPTVADTTLADEHWLRHAPVLFILSGDTVAAGEYFADQPPLGQRGQRYVWLEAGHVSQNVYLQATANGLGAVLVAGFDDDRLRSVEPAIVPGGHDPLALFALGHPTNA